jgi:hypothetical protein
MGGAGAGDADGLSKGRGATHAWPTAGPATTASLRSDGYPSPRQNRRSDARASGMEPMCAGPLGVRWEVLEGRRKARLDAGEGRVDLIDQSELRLPHGRTAVLHDSMAKNSCRLHGSVIRIPVKASFIAKSDG